MRKQHRMFYSVFFASLVFSAVYLALQRGEGLSTFFYANGASLFGDFVNNLHYPTHDGGPYFDSHWATFPPLAYTVYYLINVCYTRAVFFYEIIAYVMITVITCMLFLYALQRLLKRYQHGKDRSGEAALLAFCILLSGVMVYTIERGNSVLNVLVMLFFALDLKESQSKVQKELALILIAVAANFKLYPAIFGLLYLFEKRYREAFRLILYGVALFVIPFAWFGGLEGFLQFMANQQSIHASIRTDYFTSIPSIASFLTVCFPLQAEGILIAGKVVSAVFALLLFACILMEKRLWLRVMHMVCLFIIVPGWSAEYMPIYMSLPLALLMCETKKSKLTPLYLALFGAVFVLLPFGSGLATHVPLSWNMLVSFGGIYALTILGIADSIQAMIPKGKRRENA